MVVGRRSYSASAHWPPFFLRPGIFRNGRNIHERALPKFSKPCISRPFAMLNDEAAMAQRREQVSIALDPELWATIKRVATEEHRTVSGQIRHLVMRALAERGAERAAA
jgi:hypothetical protein